MQKRLQARIQPVILCGGSGTRLWPLSRAGFPKQFLCLTGNDSLFQQAAQRLAALADEQLVIEPPCLVTGDAHRFLATEQLRETGIAPGLILLEPVSRNTAPALTLAALAARDGGHDPILVVTPADQTMSEQAAFSHAVAQAIHEAEKGSLVILGVAPDQPETGYGYIQTLSDAQSAAPFTVSRFVEKPDQETAQRYLAEGNYFWNAGMLVLKASAWLSAIQYFRADIYQATLVAWQQRTVDQLGPHHFVRPGREAFAAIPADSIDYAVLEKCSAQSFPLKMMPLSAGWSDLGGWGAVWQALHKDPAGNAHLGDVLTVKSHNTLVHASHRLVSLVGVDNLIVIETADAVLVANRLQCQDVKRIVEQLKRDDREEYGWHRKVYRPWGWCDCLEAGERFRVNRIQLNPHASLSLQIHQHRAEHWVVVKGCAEVSCGDSVFLLTENQSSYIPPGVVHRLANPGATALEIIEIQSGCYQGEEDVQRMDASPADYP